METETKTSMKQRSQRSNAYPSYTLQESIDLTKQIYSNYGGSMFVSREQVAKMLNLSASSVILKLSSCTQYDLLEMKSGEGYKPSIHFVKIHKPLNETEKTEALIHCFSSPKLYADLITEFKNEILPYPAGLATVLFRKHSISEPVSEKAATVFIENAKFLNLLNSENILRLDNATKATPIQNNIEDNVEEIDSENVTVESMTHNKEENKNVQITVSENIEKDKRKGPSQNYINNLTGVLPFNIPLKSRKTAQIIIPEDCTKEDFDTIIKWVYLMKESYE